LRITFSPERGVSSANSSARGVEGVKTGAPAGVECVTWTMLAPEWGPERYLVRREAMAARVEVTFWVLRWPSAYLCGEEGWGG
jgi:hypothetical protein